ELRAGARVRGTGGELGIVDALVIDPTARAVTHVVVGRDRLGRRRLVTVDHVLAATPDAVELDLDGAGLEACPPFDEPDFNEPEAGYGAATLGYEPGALFLEPFASPVE